MKIVVVGDVHGNFLLLKKLLHEVGALVDNEKQEEYYVIQVGDLVNCAPSPPHHHDVLTVRMSMDVIDLQLMGNHEIYYLYQHPTGLFGGLTLPVDLGLQMELKRLLYAGQFEPACMVNDWLITHAGVHPEYQDMILEQEEGIFNVQPDVILNILFEKDAVEDSEWRNLFSAFGSMRSGGMDRRAGGIFWLDARELVEVAPQNKIKQIVGHTPQTIHNGFPFGPHVHKSSGEPIWFIDAGPGKLSALVGDENDEEIEWELVTVHE